MPTPQKSSSRKGSPKVANVARSEHRRNRYARNLRDRARRGDLKAERLYYEGRTKAGRKQGRPITR
jgi:hypothetical protein